MLLKCCFVFLGSKAKVFWLWQTFRCTPIYLAGEWTEEYYLWNNTQFNFMCEDSECQNCLFNHHQFHREDKYCHGIPNRNTSISIGRPLIYSWQTSKSEMSVVSNVFFNDTFQSCTFFSSYIEPQVSDCYAFFDALYLHFSLKHPLMLQYNTFYVTRMITTCKNVKNCNFFALNEEK